MEVWKMSEEIIEYILRDEFGSHLSRVSERFLEDERKHIQNVLDAYERWRYENGNDY
jgi:hypothetical protein